MLENKKRSLLRVISNTKACKKKSFSLSDFSQSAVIGESLILYALKAAFYRQRHNASNVGSNQD